ncbi:MAG: hypothetical protein DRH90_18360 [Deltaproteobacteria bacterium]|nr:MAG: hypothetical protein DRH90_18360 [Deltaproteobacteria bacterium]
MVSLFIVQIQTGDIENYTTMYTITKVTMKVMKSNTVSGQNFFRKIFTDRHPTPDTRNQVIVTTFNQDLTHSIYAG